MNWIRKIRKLITVSNLVIALFLIGVVWKLSPSSAEGKEMVTYEKWSKVELQFNGPQSFGMGDPNPFQLLMEVVFTGPSNQAYSVPGFYDGDGLGGLDGNIWKVRFSPGEVGTWTYITSSSEESLDGLMGSFLVSDNPGCLTTLANGLPDFSCTGRLEYVGEHFLQFNNGDFWLKSGANEPEDFLVPGVNAGFSTKEAAVNFLATRGINSIYLMLDNIDGDRKNVWPWVGETQAEAKVNHERFDVARLAGWEDIFEMIQAQGLVLHIVFEDDSAWTGFNREMYYREMVARFGYFNGLYWNLAEEFNEVYSASQIKTFAQILSNYDAYDHPLTVHQEGSLSNWEPFLGDSNFDLTSFQSSSETPNSAAADWYQKVEDSGRIIPVAFDESTRLLTSDERDKFRKIAWSIYSGGANYEVYTRLDSAGYPAYESIFADIGRARNFIGGLDYWQMSPRNDLLNSGKAFVLAQPGKTYLVYLPDGGSITLDLSGSGISYDARWFNPRTGSVSEVGQVSGDGEQGFEAPDTQDWILLLQEDTAIPPEIISIPGTAATQGKMYNYQVKASGVPAPIFSLLNSPPGMMIESGSGLIEWLPLASGNFPVEVRAENSAGKVSQRFSIEVAPPSSGEEIAWFIPLVSK